MKDFNPQTVEQLKLRYQEAIKDTYIQLDVARGIRSRPENHREHIFDFNDRVRLIISKEQEPNGRLVIHIVGMVMEVGECLRVHLNDTLVHHIVEHWALLSGNSKELEVKGLTDDESKIHFYCRLDN